MAGLSLGLLGGFDLRTSTGTPILPTQRKVAALLAYLALQPDQPHSREKLTGLLWGEHASEQARGSLRQALVHLRRLFPDVGRAALSTDSTTVVLNGGHVATDVAEFRQMLAEGTWPALERAAFLYRGDLMDGVQVSASAFEDWLTVERQQLREQALSGLHRLLAHATESAAVETGIGVGLRLLALDPLQEKTHRALMQLYARQGRLDAALRQYRACRETLERELGVQPEPETEALARELRGRRHAARTMTPAAAIKAPASDDRPAEPAPDETVAPPPDVPQPAASPAAAEPEKGGRAAERRNVTVLYAEMQGYDEMVARLDPEDLRRLVRAHYGACRAAVERHDGAINNFLGPGVLATFGHPDAREDDAERAVASALSILRATHGGAPPVRIGIASALTVVGDLLDAGETRVRELVGDAPNLAIHLAALAQPGSALVNGRARAQVGDLFRWRDLGQRILPDRPRPVTLHRLLGDGAAVSRFQAMRARHATGIFGRETEVGLLLDRWEAVRAGEGQVVLLGGEPGMGKSRILEAVRDRLADEPHGELYLQCTPDRGSSALHPLARALDSTLDAAEAGQAGNHRLERLEALGADLGLDPPCFAAPLAGLLGIPAEGRYLVPTDTPHRQRDLLFRALAAWVFGLAERQPLLVLVEDAHWLDPTTEELLGILIERARSRRILFAVSHRPDYQSPWAGRDTVTTLTLNRLSRMHCARIVQAAAAGRDVPPEVAARIGELADGVPLFVEELTRAMLDARGTESDGEDVPFVVPDGLRDLLRGRLARSGTGLRVAQIAAAIGRDAPYELLLAVAGRPEGEVRDALDRLVGAGLMLRRAASSGDVYAFKHALVQEAAHDSLLREDRARIHRDLARVLEERDGASEPEILARHWSEAAEPERASIHWLRAGREAAARSALTEAIAHFRRALGALRDACGAADCRERETDVLTALGTAYLATRGFAAPEVGETYGRARALCEETGDHARQVRVLGGLMQFDTVRGRLSAALGHARQCLMLGERHGIEAYRQIAHCGMAGALLWMGRFEEAGAQAERAVELYRPGMGETARLLLGGDSGVYALCYAGLLSWHLGRPDRAADLLDRARTHAAATGHPFSRAYALGHSAAVHLLRGEPDAVRTHASAGIALCLEQGFRYYLTWCTVLDGWAMAVAGDPAGVVRMREGIAGLRATGARLRMPWHHVLMAERLLALDRPEEAHAALAGAGPPAEGTDDGGTEERWQEPDRHRIRGLLRLRAGDRAGAEHHLTAAWNAATACGSPMLALRAASELARLHLSARRRDRAHELLAPTLSAVEEDGTEEVRTARALLAACASADASSGGRSA